MSLVAYGSSDESDSDVEVDGSSPRNQKTEEPTEEAKTGTANLIQESVCSVHNANSSEHVTHLSTSKSSLFTSLPPPKKSTTLNNSDDEFFSEEIEAVTFLSTNSSSAESESRSTNVPSKGLHLNLPAPKHSAKDKEVDEKGILFTSLPAPQKRVQILEDGIKEDDLEPTQLKKDYSDSEKNDVPTFGTPSAVARKQPVKITIPSLSEFQDDDEKDAEPPSKKLKPSAKGSGLFALLPAPKNATRKEANRKLIPHAVSKKTTANAKKPARHAVEKPGALLATYGDSGEDSDDESSADFFSLTSKVSDALDFDAAPFVPQPVLSESAAVIQDTLSDKPLSFRTEFKPETWSGATEQQAQQYEWHGTGAAGAEPQQGVPLSSGASLENEETDESLQLDEEALQRLCGRKGRHKDVQLIDVSGDAVMPNANDWLTKQLTEEKETRSHSHRKKDGPTTQQRRKHQITYLAFQAKERELELKNQWAQNRMSRKQTQAKYGF